MKRLTELDGMKIFFCLGIVLYHYYVSKTMGGVDFANVPRLSGFVYMYGYLGVEFFFILSGFMMSYTYKQTIREMTIGVFLRRRLRTLFPAYILSVLLGILIAPLDIFMTDGQVIGKSLSLYDILCSFSMTAKGYIRDDINPHGSGTWFVCVLVVCYIIFYFIITKSKDYQSYIAMCSIMVFWGWACSVNGYSIPFMSMHSGRGYVSFFTGCLLYEINDKVRFKTWQLLSLFSIAMVYLFAGRHLGYDVVFGNVNISFTFFIFPVIILCVENIEIVKKIFASRYLVALSKYCMPIFLSHSLIFALIMIFNSYFNLNLQFSSYAVLAGSLGLVILGGLLFKLILDKIVMKIIRL